MKLTKRGMIRLCTIPLAAIAALSAKDYMLTKSVQRSQYRIENNYSRAVEELASSCDSISSILEKQLYAGSSDMQRSLAADLYRDAYVAKAALSQLPVAELDLENTYKFLSQVGNYSLSLSKKLASGQRLSDEEYKNILSLYNFSTRLCEDMWNLEGEIAGGELSLSDAKEISYQGEPPHITEGFTDFEGGFDEYPKLIYDGPFSDNIMERTPKMTEEADEVEESFALQKAATALDVDPSDLTQSSQVDGKMPGWRFSDANNEAFCEVTKQGGYISYFLNMRNVDTKRLDPQTAEQKARDFLDYLGVESMETTYYEINNNVMTVNFCYLDTDKRVYPDLIKVSVAMDNGDILGFDARGFLVNHSQREYPQRLCSINRAKQEISPKLEITAQNIAVIPTDGMNEKLCYEFACKAPSGRNVLVYINAETAKEEQILILLESESGTLAV